MGWRSFQRAGEASNGLEKLPTGLEKLPTAWRSFQRAVAEGLAGTFVERHVGPYIARKQHDLDEDSSMQRVTLNNGVQMPILGYGVLGKSCFAGSLNAGSWPLPSRCARSGWRRTCRSSISSWTSRI